MKPLQCVIGAAGHIDHGKTGLIEALTGVDCDRFREEKERGITIDIGFASLELSDGSVVGIVDVPGHLGFIHNMLAGAAGIDVALFVVAADDAVMPQTIEHLAILEMLGVDRGVVALTKSDLVDTETLELAMIDVEELIGESLLAGSRIIPCSSVTGDGVEEVRRELEKVSLGSATKRRDGFFRMPIDRVFTMKGHGVVVTGTAFSGEVKPDDRLTIVPGDHEVRVRRVHSYGETVASAAAGMRTALNIAGAEKDQIMRGAVICGPAIGRAYTQFTAELLCHRTSPSKIAHGRSYLLHVHTAETLCRVYLAADKSLEAGRRCVAQIRFGEPIQLVNGDRFVLRSSSAQHTLGGGAILEPGGRPMGRRRLVMHQETWDALTQTDSGVLAMVRQRPLGRPVKELMGIFNLPKTALNAVFKRLKDDMATFDWKGETYAFDLKKSRELEEAMVKTVTQFHKKNPALQGIEESALARVAAPEIDERLAGYWIRRVASTRKIVHRGSVLKIPGREAEFSGDDKRLRNMILEAYHKGGLKSPPKTDKVHDQLNIKKSDAVRMLRILAQTGDLVTLAPDYTLHRDTLEKAKSILLDELKKEDSIETARYRDLLGVGRKAAIDILEHFDKAGITKRIENRRVLASKVS